MKIKNKIKCNIKNELLIKGLGFKENLGLFQISTSFESKDKGINKRIRSKNSNCNSVEREKIINWNI